MPDLDPIAVAAATLAAFLAGGAYYALLGNQLATVSGATTEPPGPSPRWSRSCAAW